MEFKDSTSTIFSEDGSVTPDYKVGEMLRNLRLASERIGITMDHAPSLKGWMEQAGFTNIEQRTMRLPIGTWPKNKRLVRTPHSHFLSHVLSRCDPSLTVNGPGRNSLGQ